MSILLYIQICICICMYVYIYICICICIYLYIYVSYIHKYTYIHVYIHISYIHNSMYIHVYVVHIIYKTNRVNRVPTIDTRTSVLWVNSGAAVGRMSSSRLRLKISSTWRAISGSGNAKGNMGIYKGYTITYIYIYRYRYLQHPPVLFFCLLAKSTQFQPK